MFAVFCCCFLVEIIEIFTLHLDTTNILLQIGCQLTAWARLALLNSCTSAKEILNLTLGYKLLSYPGYPIQGKSSIVTGLICTVVMDVIYAILKVYVTEHNDIIKRHSNVITIWQVSNWSDCIIKKPTFRSKKCANKKNLSWVWGVDRKIHPSWS